MSKKRKFAPSALVALAALFAAVMASPASSLQETMTLQPVDDRDVPEGSQIPEWRINEIEEKVRDIKTEMRQRSLQQQQQQTSPQSQTSTPNGN